MTANYIIERFEADDLVPHSARFVGCSYEEALAIIAADRAAFPGVDFRLRTIYHV